VTALAWNKAGSARGSASRWRWSPRRARRGGGLSVLSLRITGHYFALVTLALSGIVLQVITATRDHTGGSLGYTPERYQGGSSLYALQFTSKTTWYLIALGVWAVGLWIWYRVDRSMLRYALEAISEDEDAAAATGVHVTAEKLKITVLSAVMTALAGALYCQYQMFISPTR
jgi:branched-chain amino acid transport system permease protein